MMEKYFKRIRNFFIDTFYFGLYIAITNAMWPILAKMPLSFVEKVMERKKKIVNSYIIKKTKSVLDSYSTYRSNPKYIHNACIWVCWLQGETQMPDVVRKCFDSIKRHSSGHEVILITLENYSRYINLPSFIIDAYEKKNIGQAHFADIVRTVLLAERGGCWIDSTILMTADINEEVFNNPFYSCRFKQNKLYVTENIWSNFFLASQPGSIVFLFVRDMFYEYLKKQNRFIDYFMMDYIIRLGYDLIPEIKNEIEQVSFNNENVHDLIKHLNLPVESLNAIIDGTYIHKLNWRINSTNFQKGTVGYKYLMS